MRFALSSPAFQAHTPIPKPYTCDGTDISPALTWTDPPAGTKSFALIMDDPDAPVGTWVHWVVYNLPAAIRHLPEQVPALPSLADQSRQGRNDFRRVGYGGPCPPPGPAHRYVFKLYALDTMLGLEAGQTKAELERTMEGHILDKAELVGTYRR
ncbi:MAG: YbhB/YbcL family Raf kinase inhibitor-like protein [Candidatus Omnitrophica bacterium]|nr:YbhB/YbcL family Raf kinase inhibitor-like protein [Candidatus Omnitrophota bacterium]